jgi:hypothetical protein
MEVGTGDKTDTGVADGVILSTGSWKPHFTRVVIR